MAKISITNFGGIAPSIDPLELGLDRAQKAEDLDPRYGDFRPLKGLGASSATTVTAGTKSLHRTDQGTWLSSTNVVDYVNSQINDPSVERVYLTGRSAYPEAWEDGSYRRLGVQMPAAAPAVTLNEVDEFTPADRQQAINDLIADIKTAVLANITPTLLANPKPSDPGGGAIFLDHGDDAELPTTLDTQIAYLTPTTGGSVDIESDAYLQEPILAGKTVTYSAQEYWAIGALWRPVGYSVDESAMSTAIKALLAPPENTDQLVPDAVADQIAARVAAIADPTTDPLAILIDRVNSAQDDVVTFQTRELTDLARAYALKGQLEKLEGAIRAVDEYFVQWETRLLQVLADYEYLITPAVDRVVETRAYRYTYVTDWGEESAPSQPSDLLNLDQNDSATVVPDAYPGGSGYGTVVSWRLYRSSTTNKGAAWQFVAEVAIGTLTYTDTKAQEELEEELTTETWAEPRADMVNLCGGPNGMMLGSVGNVICACEPDAPYAWPREYEISVANKIVTIHCTGQSWIVLTEGQNYLVSGADSASLSALKLGQPQACVSKRAVAPVEGGCMFASPDGVCLADTGGVSLLTLGAYEKLDWAALTPANSFGAFSEGIYHLWLSTAGKRLSMDLVKSKLTLTPYSGVTAAYTNLLSDTLYNVVSTSVLPMFAGSFQTALYRTGVLQTNSLPSFAWIRVDGDFASGTVRVYADGALCRTVTVAGGAPVRMKAKRGRTWEMEFESDERAVALHMASSAEELR